MFEISRGPDYAVKNQNFSFASYFSDHMVLQASPKRAVVWGYASPGTEGQTVTITVLARAKISYEAVVAENLIWSTKIGINCL